MELLDLVTTTKTIMGMLIITPVGAATIGLLVSPIKSQVIINQ